jgi:hypothetical protein
VLGIESLTINDFLFTEEPQTPPLMIAGKLKYSKDESVSINCTSYSAFPATNLTWFINDKKVSCGRPLKWKIYVFPIQTL